MTIAIPLSLLRTSVLPPLHTHVLDPRGQYAARRIREEEYVGRVPLDRAEFRRLFEWYEKTYRNSFASVKYRDESDGRRTYEIGSWAYRPDGLLGVWQTHLMPFATGDGAVDLYAHYERSPLRAPRKHYDGDGWDADEGVARARSLLDELGLSYTVDR